MSGEEKLTQQSTSHAGGQWGGHPMFGTAGLLVGAVIVGLSFVDQTSGLPFSMPASWYANRPLWYMLALGGFAAGYWFLRGSRVSAQADQLGPPGPRFERVVLYTRRECPLCDEARDVLSEFTRYLPSVQEVDVDAHPQLAEQFGQCVPVVEIDGRVRFRGVVNRVLLQRLILAHGP